METQLMTKSFEELIKLTAHLTTPQALVIICGLGVVGLICHDAFEHGYTPPGFTRYEVA